MNRTSPLSLALGLVGQPALFPLRGLWLLFPFSVPYSYTLRGRLFDDCRPLLEFILSSRDLPLFTLRQQVELPDENEVKHEPPASAKPAAAINVANYAARPRNCDTCSTLSKTIKEREHKCTTPIEEFFIGLIQRYGWADQKGEGLTVKDYGIRE